MAASRTAIRSWRAPAAVRLAAVPAVVAQPESGAAASVVLSMSAAGAVTCLFVLRRREGAAVVAGIGYPWVPGIFVAATLVFGLLSAVQRPREWIAAIVTLLSGLVAYRIFRR